MGKSNKGNERFSSSALSRKRISGYTLLLAVSWSLIILVAVGWDAHREKKLTFRLATKEARAHFNKDQAFRLWATEHGGIYVPVDARTPPNPYLTHVKERDIETESGRSLTLMNPAYMLRQMMTEYGTLYGIKGRITSTKPLNPDNAPDPWERSALERLQNGAREVFEITKIQGAPFLRLIRPMMTSQGCLKCHAHQGYHEGDIRGGVGVSVPLAPYLANQASEIKESILSHIMIWGIGLLVIFTGFMWSRHQFAGQERAEAALLESEEKYRLAMEATLDGVWDWDISTGSVTYSDAWANMLSLDTAEQHYRTWESRIHPDDKPRVMSSLEDHFAGKTGFWTLEHRLQTEGGQWKWVLGRGRVVETSPEGKPVRMVGTMTDIAERKKTEQALKESEERFKRLHNASFGGIAIHDKGVILDCNQGLSLITGYGTNDLIGMNGLMLIAPDWRDVVMGHILSGWEKPYEVEGCRKSGETYPLRLEARNIPFKGKSVRVVEFRDISEQRKAEAEHEKLQEQLIQARKMESVGRLAGGVAHDFNNMLSIIIGNTELAIEDLGDAEAVSANLEEIQRAAERSADLTRQLLAFARKQTVNPRVVDVNTVIGEMLKMLERLIGEGIELSWQPGAPLWSVKIDPSQVDQLMANLCINARDAIADIGRVEIATANQVVSEEESRRYPDADPGEYVVIRVTDTGCGMDEKTVSSLFEPFFTTKAVGHGSGLGLATVYGIVKQNNGFITVSSAPDQGADFRIFLPRYVGVEDTADPAGQSLTAFSGTETILIVEDEAAILDMATRILQRMGYRVLSAATPGEALKETIRCETGIDLLLTDVVMPEMNGRLLSEKLKAGCPKMKSLFMSGYTADIIAEHGVLEDGVCFLNKPFTRQELAERVRAVLGSA